jgi:SagB-type dehydrogenase family enzyme
MTLDAEATDGHRTVGPEVVLAVDDSLSLYAEGEDRLVASSPSVRFTWTRLAPPTRRALLELGRRPMTWPELASVVAGESEQEGVGRLELEVNRLLSRLRLRVLLRDAKGDILVLDPQGPLCSLQLPLPEVRYPVRLSRFAALRRRGLGMVVDSPLASFRVELARPAMAALIAGCAEPTGRDELVQITSSDPATVDAAVQLLVAGGVLAEVGPGGRLEEDTDPVLRQRDALDLHFHARTRTGLTADPVGATYRFDDLPPTPAIRPASGLPAISLPRPAGGSAGPGLWDVVRQRRSVRRYGAPITVDQLGEFLFRVARAENVVEPEQDHTLRYGVSDRPYPSGGKTYDLEFYLTVRECDGLDAGLYRYLPTEHALERLPVPAPLRDRLLQDAYYACGQRVVPQVLVTLTSRFTRLSWKYEGMSYATTLKNVGVVYELMYLAATALGIAPCGLGAGNAASFSRAIGIPVAQESSVGEFMLGSMPDR